MLLIKKTSGLPDHSVVRAGIISLLIAGIFLVSCSSAPAPESARPAQPIQPAAPKVNETFNTHLNALITQLGDYDYKKQRNAAKEIQELIDNFIKATAENPEYDSPELDYLILAMDYASEKGSPPDQEGMVDAALQSLAIEIWKPAKWRLIVHPDIISLKPELISQLNDGANADVLSWLMSQPVETQRKGVNLYTKYLSTDDESKWLIMIKFVDIGFIKYLPPLLDDCELWTKERFFSYFIDFIQSKIIDGLDDRNSTVKKESIDYLKHSVKDILLLLKNKDEKYRERIIIALRKTGDKSFVKDLLPMINDDNKFVRWAVAEILTGFSDIRAVPIWIDALNHSDTFNFAYGPGGSASGCSIKDVANIGLGKLTDRKNPGKDNDEMPLPWQDWWVKEGKAWYDEEVKKIKDE